MIRLILSKTREVEIENGKWRCKESRQFQDMLNLQYTPDKIFYSIFYDYDLAEMAIKDWGGKILEVINPPKYVKGRVY